MDTINERIARCIVITGLTKTAFAKRINLSQPHISKITLGDSVPSDRTILDICREFNISETWLRTGEGEMFTNTPETLAEKLSREYGLDNLGRQIMAAYLKLDEQDRLSVGRLIQNIIDERTAQASASAAETPANPPREMSDAELHAELDRQLAEEKKQVDGQSASGRGSSGTAAG